jgi:hypothetical protein
MILEIDLETIYQELGHDGSKRVRDKPEPLCRRGFHPQELIQVCSHSRGWVVETLEARPRFEDNIIVKVPFHLQDKGILLSARHAVVWTGTKILDPGSMNSHCRNYQLYLRFISVSSSR